MTWDSKSAPDRRRQQVRRRQRRRECPKERTWGQRLQRGGEGVGGGEGCGVWRGGGCCGVDPRRSLVQRRNMTTGRCVRMKMHVHSHVHEAGGIESNRMHRAGRHLPLRVGDQRHITQTSVITRRWDGAAAKHELRRRRITPSQTNGRWPDDVDRLPLV